MRVRFTILGPVGVSVGDRMVPGAAPRHRAVLAYLLLHARTVISTDRLIGAIWGLTPPGTARAQIHASIAVIRKVLREAGAAQVLQTRAAGYVIVSEPGQLDLEEFTSRIVAARTADDPAAQLRAALALWRDEAFADVLADYVDEARARLTERRLTVVERLAELELAQGRHEELIDELTSHLAVHPLREKLCGHLMLALHRSGRQADALTVARTFRDRLVEQQGLDPSRTFLTLEQAILRDDAGLHPHSTPVQPAPVAGPAPRPSFLPWDTPDFAGRTTELDRLDRSGTDKGAVVIISAIDGMAGIGKTTLAVHAAHRLAAHYPDGQLFIDLHAHTTGQTPVEPGTALEVLLRQLGVPADRIPAADTERAALWRAELTHRRVLIVLDNAADTDHVRPLLPGASHSLMLITSRRRLVDLDGARALSLDLLSATDAVELFTAIVGERAIAEPVAVLDVLQLCGFLPLAVRIAAARLHHRPRWTVEYLADRLRDQRRRLGELSTSERGVAAAFTLSYQQLNPDQQRLFRLLSLHPGADIDPYAAAALADFPLEKAEALLEDLLDAHVLLQHEPGRYTFHDLLRDHARSVASASESADARHDALTRLFDHYLYTASAAIDLLYPGGDGRRPRIPEPGTPTRCFGDVTQATAWLDAERVNLIATATHAADRDWPTHTSHLSITLFYYLYERAHHADALTLHTQALSASRHRSDRSGEARALIHLGVVNCVRGRHAQAAQQSRQALNLFRRLGDRNGEAATLNNLGNLHLMLREYDEAHKCYRCAIDLCRELGRRLNEAVALGNVGLVYERQGRYEEAHDYHRQALDLHRELGGGQGEARVLNNLGRVYQRQGRYEQALDHHRQALDLHCEIGSRDGETEALNHLGEAERLMSDPAQAVDRHHEALALALELGNHPEQGRAHDGLARAHRDLGRLDLAHDHAKLALDLYTGLGVPEVDEVRDFLAGLG
ncbi:AfsR/SARP family transcriptional regulator [Nonomuraea basaltis]|uniref:AfsR/SARP family transcriptional regulator n=1 Tax=Nonomuraea basaltis TaxID=2495887 RepID=UPI00110C56AC|nr:tetratricopeptide repeat protein [Nonomuraea basaltis]TMR99215.1 tetratricopeptide repeat protein [Nonomuraea basaltis]